MKFEKWLFGKKDYNPFTRELAEAGERLPEVKLPEGYKHNSCPTDFNEERNLEEERIAEELEQEEDDQEEAEQYEAEKREWEERRDYEEAVRGW